MTEYVVDEENRLSLCDRNSKLWCALNDMNAYVRPIRIKGEGKRGNLVALVVSADPMPFDLTVTERGSEFPSEAGVDFRFERNPVSGDVSPAQGQGVNVVNLPPKS